MFIHGHYIHDHFKTEADIRAYCETGGGRVYFGGFADNNECESFIAKFPKFVKVKANPCHTYDRETGKWGIFPQASFLISGKTKVTGSQNETGQKRINSLIKTLRELGHIS